MEETKKMTDPEKELKRVLNLEWVTKVKLGSFNANQYLLRDICHNQKNSAITKFLGWDDPQKIPFYPVGGESYRAATSGSDYNTNLIVPGQRKIEYDFREAYTTIARGYALPSNTFLEHVKYTREKIEKRFSEYPEKLPYKNLSTFAFLKIKIKAIAKPETYTEWGSHFQTYTKALSRTLTVSEVELKLIYDFYDIQSLEVLDSYVFKCRPLLLKDYFDRIDKLKENPDTVQYYKDMRNAAIGLIGKMQFKDKKEKELFSYPFYNRAYASSVYGIFRDVMARYEQKYVYSDYGLIKIKTDGIYFRREVPEFERLYQLGIVKKKESIITNEDHNEISK